MDNIVEVRFFQCTCSKCKQVVENKHGWADLQENGWKWIGKMLLCPECYAPYENLDPQIGDTVRCLVQRDSYRQVQYMETYRTKEHLVIFRLLLAASMDSVIGRASKFLLD